MRERVSDVMPTSACEQASDEHPAEADVPPHGPQAPSRNVVELALWAITAAVGVLVATQAFGWEMGGVVAAAQSLTGFASLALIPTIAYAVASRWYVMAGVGALAVLGVVVLAVPLIFPGDQPDARPGAQGVRIAVVNLLYENDQVREVADVLATRSADLIVFSEYTAEHQAELLAHTLVDDYPHRVELDGLFAGGTAVWSRHPLTAEPTADMTNYDVDVAVDAPDGVFRLWAVHPAFPFNAGWGPDLDTIADRAPTIDAPLVVAGDFNASYWHPAFRDILATGLTDAHIALDRGWSTSWPTDRWHPSFVRIDHALTNEGMVATAVSDFDVPGSDHRGFVVTVAPTG